ncbi:unnamed protein product, partial [Polarella glacialis]
LVLVEAFPPSRIEGFLSSLAAACAAGLLAAASLTVTSVCDLLADPFAPAAEELAQQRAQWDFVGWAHLKELPHVLGVFLLLQLIDGPRRSDPSKRGDTNNNNKNSNNNNNNKKNNTNKNNNDNDNNSNNHQSYTWSALSAMARLCPGVNAAHIFVMDFVVGFAHDRPAELSVVTLMGFALANGLIAFVVALLVHLFVVAPCDNVVRRIWSAR